MNDQGDLRKAAGSTSVLKAACCLPHWLLPENLSYRALQPQRQHQSTQRPSVSELPKVSKVSSPSALTNLGQPPDHRLVLAGQASLQDRAATGPIEGPFQGVPAHEMCGAMSAIGNPAGRGPGTGTGTETEAETGSGRGTATEIEAEVEAGRGSENRTATGTEQKGILATMTACGSGPRGSMTMSDCMAGAGMTTIPRSEQSPCRQSG